MFLEAVSCVLCSRRPCPIVSIREVWRGYLGACPVFVFAPGIPDCTRSVLGLSGCKRSSLASQIVSVRAVF